MSYFNLKHLAQEYQLQASGVAGIVNAGYPNREKLLRDSLEKISMDTLNFDSYGCQIQNDNNLNMSILYVSVCLHKNDYNSILNGCPYVIEPIVQEFSIHKGVHLTLLNNYEHTLAANTVFDIDDGMVDFSFIIHNVYCDVMDQISLKSYDLVVVDYTDSNSYRNQFIAKFKTSIFEDEQPNLVVVSDDMDSEKLACSLELYGVKSELLTSMYNGNSTIFRFLCQGLSTGNFACGEFRPYGFKYSPTHPSWVVFEDYNNAPLMYNFCSTGFSFFTKEDKALHITMTAKIRSYMAMSDHSSAVKLLLAKFTDEVLSKIQTVNDVYLESL
ncbi:TPA: hypothetical protein ACX6RO_001893 [Photobacterium damselae]